MASSAETLFDQITIDPSISQAQIERLIRDKVPESEFLDYKGADKLNDDSIKEHWSKALSAFANTGGGVLIWGVDCREQKDENGIKLDLPTGKALHPNAQQLAQRFTALHPHATADFVEGVKVRAVPFDGGSAGCVVCLIPEGRNKPYRAMFANEHYFVRNPDRMQRVSHSLLRSLFYAKATGRLSFSIHSSPPQVVNHEIDINFKVDLENVGSGTANDIFIRITTGISMKMENVRTDFWQQIKTEGNNKADVFNFSGLRPIHPGFSRDLCNFRLIIPQHTTSISNLRFTFDTFMRDSEPARAAAEFYYGVLTTPQQVKSIPDPI